MATVVGPWLLAAVSLSLAAELSFAQASPAHTRSTTASSASFHSLAARATAARDAERLDEAVPLFRKALAIRRGWAEGWWSLGTIEYDRSQYAAAAQEFQKLLPLAPKDGTARVMLGLCEFELGRDEAALKNLQEGQALGMATDQQLQQVALYHEGVLLLRAGQFKLSQTSFGLICKMDVGSDRVMDGIGLSVLRISPKQAPAAGSANSEVVRRAGSASCLTAARKFDEANRQFAMLVADHPDF
jgi:tetratricopeptide (TPR) repeat protein